MRPRRRSLTQLAARHGTDKAPAYLEQYERLLTGRRTERLRLLEIGIYRGGSLAMWREYLPRAEIIGIDIDPDLRRLETELGVTVWIADQGDRSQLDEALASQPRGAGEGFDLVIDDGGHQQHQVLTSFEVLYPHLRPGGTYVIEDVGTAYWTGYGGRDVGQPGTSVALVKTLVDSVHEQATRVEGPEAFGGIASAVTAESRAQLRTDVAAVEVYPQVMFIKKR